MNEKETHDIPVSSEPFTITEALDAYSENLAARHAGHDPIAGWVRLQESLGSTLDDTVASDPSHETAPVAEATDTAEPAFRSLLVVDVENSSRQSEIGLLAVRSTLYRIWDETAADTEGVGATRDRGHGFAAVLDLPALDVLDSIVEKFLAGVREHNNLVDPLKWLRVRVAVHEGYVMTDEHGPVGDALTTTSRLSDASIVRKTLELASRAWGVVAVSDSVYQGIRHNFRASVMAESYRQATVSTKLGDMRIWIRVPGYPEPPLPTEEGETRQYGPVDLAHIRAHHAD